jgi:hypothetical protein
MSKKMQVSLGQKKYYLIDNNAVYRVEWDPKSKGSLLSYVGKASKLLKREVEDLEMGINS